MDISSLTEFSLILVSKGFVCTEDIGVITPMICLGLLAQRTKAQRHCVNKGRTDSGAQACHAFVTMNAELGLAGFRLPEH